MTQRSNGLLFLLTATTSITAVSSSLMTPWFLRGSSSSDPSSSSEQTTATSIATPYDDLITCMWNGTNVGACHALDCKWCHASFSDICVTDEYAVQLNGTIFHCEGGGHSKDDDDAVAPHSDDDDTVVPPVTPPSSAPIAPVPTTPAPQTSAPSSVETDDVVPITDDDPNHTANEIYMKRLLHCMTIGTGAAACEKDTICTWCTHGSASPAPGMCFSKQAAKEMNGAYYTCNVRSAGNDNDDTVSILDEEKNNVEIDVAVE